MAVLAVVVHYCYSICYDLIRHRFYLFGCTPIRRTWDQQIPGSCLKTVWKRNSTFVQAGKGLVVSGIDSTGLIDIHVSG